MTRAIACLIVGVGCVSGASVLAQAEEIVLSAFDRGYYFEKTVPSHEPHLLNYLARESGPQDPTRNFLVFDLSSVVGTITQAELRLYNPGAKNGADGFYSPNGSEVFTVFDVATPVEKLLKPGRYEGGEIFDDLGSGTVLGNQAVTKDDNGAFVTVSLNDDFLALANHMDGLLALGGRVSNGWVFGYTPDVPLSDTQLVMTVETPEPSAIVLLGMGAVALLVWKRRR